LKTSELRRTRWALQINHDRVAECGTSEQNNRIRLVQKVDSIRKNVIRLLIPEFSPPSYFLQERTGLIRGDALDAFNDPNPRRPGAKFVEPPG
jgi:hypothetical protein